MIIQPLHASSLRARIAAAVLIVVTAIAFAAAREAAAAETEVRAEDRTAVASCLDLVAQASKRQSEDINKAEAADDAAPPKTEKIDAAEWLRHAGERASVDETSCIGVVSTPCQQTDQGRTEAGTNACLRRELAVWDERLNKSYKRWIDTCGEIKVCAARRKFARAWLAAREARCALPWIEMQGTMANPLTNFCLLDVTARHAIWLGGDEQ